MNRSHIQSGIRWTLLTSVFRRLITLILFYFVARWLTKEDLGIFREYSLILGFFTMVFSFSLDFNYIIEQKKQYTGLVALWQMTFIASAVGFVLLIAGSGILGMLYKSPVLGNLFRFTSIFLVIELLRRAVRTVAAKQMQFKQLSLAETYNVVFYSIITVVALYFYRSLWVYLIIFYLGNIVEMLYLWKLNHTVISKSIRHLFKQGRIRILKLTLHRYSRFLTQATLVSAINTFSSNAPILVMGMIFNPVYMGLYFFASQLIGVPIGVFNAAINQVFFPVFAGRNDHEISNTSFRFIRLTGFAGLPVLLLFSFLVQCLIPFVFGDKWSDAVKLIPVVFFIYGFSLYCNPLGGIPLLKKKPQWELIWNIASFSIKIGAMFLGLLISFKAGIWAFAIASAVMSVIFYLMSMLLVQVKLTESIPKLLISWIPFIIYIVFIEIVMHLPLGAAITSSILGCGVLLWLVNIFSKGLLLSDLRLFTAYK
jgi:O-antigen/teichoic acid export membrane protein